MTDTPSITPLNPPKPDQITITMSRGEAEAMSLGLSDFLCWADGFNAARAGTEHDHTGPLGVHEARELNIKLKDALE